MKKVKDGVTIEYFPTEFSVWNEEAVSVITFLGGKGVDVGCGVRSLREDVVRVDKNPEVKPDHVADAAKLPFEDGKFDFMWSSHNLEHSADTLAVILEAQRVVKAGGYLVFIIPDKRYTAGLDPTHQHEWEPQEFIEPYKLLPGLQLVDFGRAGKNWSFRVVYQVLEDTLQQPDLQATAQIVERGLQELQPRNLRRDPIRLSSIGDHPRLTTGLGLVHRQILAGFQRALYRVSVLGTMDTTPTRQGEFPYYVESVCEHDFYGYETGPRFLHRTSPEVLFMVGDPGSLDDRLSTMFVLGHVPIKTVIYFPIEGAPLHKGILSLVERVQASGGRAITYTQWGADRIAEQSEGKLRVDWVHHGIDHAPFRPYPAEERERLRNLVGWQDKFVVMNVSRNKRTNRHMAYIQAARMLKDEGIGDVVFYLHCDPLDKLAISGMGGMDLKQIVEYYNVSDMVLFPPDVHDQLHGCAYHQLQGTTFLPPPAAEQRGAAFARLSLIDRYNCADMYMDASSVQGFNLPNVEAMACGLPVWATDDHGVRREVLAGAAHYLEPATVDYWHTGAQLWLVDPLTIADAVKDAREAHAEGDGWQMWREQSLERAKQFKWKTCQDKFIEAVKEVVEA